MSNASTFRRLGTPVLHLTLAAGFLGCAAFFLALHADTVRDVREVALPAAATIPALEKRASVLREQLEIGELQQVLLQGSQSEQIETYVLPAAPEQDRLIALFEVLADELSAAQQMRKMQPIRISEPEPDSTLSLLSQAIDFHAELTGEGVAHLQTIIRLSGLITVGDALADSERAMLLRLTEEQNPAALAVLERFFSIPLLQYAREPKPFEEQVLRSFAGDAFAQSFAASIQRSLLQDAKEFFASSLGQRIVERQLWPMRFLTLERLETEEGSGGWHPVGVNIRAYHRRSS